MKRILIVDDDKSFRESITLNLVHKDWQYLEAKDGVEALEVVKSQNPDLIICDIRMPKMNGIEFLEKVKALYGSARMIIMITAFEDMQTTVKAIQLGAYDYITKPPDLEKLTILIKRALENQEINQRLDGLLKTIGKEYQMDNIIGKTPGMLEVFKMIGAVSTSRVTVLIRGESGTGKELIARAIHYSSFYREHPFIPVNCTSIPENLIESELFGHEKGSFTGAIAQCKGKFELAGEGTIFLDEIGDMPLQMQTKLLRVIQERTFERIGGNRIMRTEARIIAATHKDIEKKLTEGEFREDLYYRLKVVEIKVPPLRQRREDISLLVDYLMEKINRELGTSVRKVSPEVVEHLTSLEWKGNVRELENVLRRAIVLCRSEILLITDLQSTPESSEQPLTPRIRSTCVTLAEAEKEYILQVLNTNHWNKKRSCEVLNIARTTLDRKIEQYHLKKDNKNA